MAGRLWLRVVAVAGIVSGYGLLAPALAFAHPGDGCAHCAPGGSDGPHGGGPRDHRAVGADIAERENRSGRPDSRYPQAPERAPRPGRADTGDGSGGDDSGAPYPIPLRIPGDTSVPGRASDRGDEVDTGDQPDSGPGERPARGVPGAHPAGLFGLIFGTGSAGSSVWPGSGSWIVPGSAGIGSAATGSADLGSAAPGSAGVGSALDTTGSVVGGTGSAVEGAGSAVSGGAAVGSAAPWLLLLLLRPPVIPPVSAAPPLPSIAVPPLPAAVPPLPAIPLLAVPAAPAPPPPPPAHPAPPVVAQAPNSQIRPTADSSPLPPVDVLTVVGGVAAMALAAAGSGAVSFQSASAAQARVDAARAEFFGPRT